jgi:hypothetical protein
MVLKERCDSTTGYISTFQIFTVVHVEELATRIPWTTNVLGWSVLTARSLAEAKQEALNKL